MGKLKIKNLHGGRRWAIYNILFYSLLIYVSIICPALLRYPKNSADASASPLNFLTAATQRSRFTVHRTRSNIAPSGFESPRFFDKKICTKCADFSMAPPRGYRRFAPFLLCDRALCFAMLAVPASQCSLKTVH